MVALFERNGRALSKPIGNVTTETLKAAITQNVRRHSRIMTEEWPAYQGIRAEFTGGHEIVNHRRKEFVQRDAYTNTVESYLALLKKGVHGTFHHISKRHFHRYCDEPSFRRNPRRMTDGQSVFAVITASEETRLSCRLLVSCPANKLYSGLNQARTQTSRSPDAYARNQGDTTLLALC
ncbi:MAG: IS1595 family transposase [Thermodesulfobacteriota bacterium]